MKGKEGKEGKGGKGGKGDRKKLSGSGHVKSRLTNSKGGRGKGGLGFRV